MGCTGTPAVKPPSTSSCPWEAWGRPEADRAIGRGRAAALPNAISPPRDEGITYSTGAF
jgi:hypothetical protein